MRSAALNAALVRVASRERVTTSAVLMSAVGAVLGALTGQHTAVLKLILGNRGVPALRDLVAVVVSNGLALLDLRGGTFADLVHRTALGTLQAMVRSQCDPVGRDQLIADVNNDRGVAMDLSSFFNDFRSRDTANPVLTPDDALQALTETTTVDWIGQWERQDAKFFFHAASEDRCDPVYFMVDTAFIDRPTTERTLRALERLVVAAALRPGLPLAELSKVTGLEPHARSSGRALVDHCWVRLDDVQELVSQAVPGAEVLVDDPDDSGLVAYIAVTDTSWTPRTVHQAVMRALSGRPTAISPRRYVLCERAVGLGFGVRLAFRTRACHG